MASRRFRPASLSVRACAKINLTLRVTGRRSDGYHDVRTVLQTVTLHDTLTFHARRGAFRIECNDPSCPTDRRNLVWGAAQQVWRAAGRRGLPRDVVIRIEKRIPLRAGLGGGSSDAAAAIRALSHLWNVHLADGRQQAIAASLGSDVPFFLRGGTALGLKRGELLFPLVDLPASWVVLVIPPFGVSTDDAYSWWDAESASFDPSTLRQAEGRPERGRGTTKLWVSPSLSRSDTLALNVRTRELRNDLEGPVTSHHPEIAQIVRALRRAGATYAAMSGSGSAVFGLFQSKAAADRAARVSATHRGRALVTRTSRSSTYRAMSAPR